MVVLGGGLPRAVMALVIELARVSEVVVRIPHQALLHCSPARPRLLRPVFVLRGVRVMFVVSG